MSTAVSKDMLLQRKQQIWWPFCLVTKIGLCLYLTMALLWMLSSNLLTLRFHLKSLWLCSSLMLALWLKSNNWSNIKTDRMTGSCSYFLFFPLSLYSSCLPWVYVVYVGKVRSGLRSNYSSHTHVVANLNLSGVCIMNINMIWLHNETSMKIL